MKKIAFLLLFSSFSFGQSLSKSINLLPDTGQNLSYTNTFGEDQDYTINPPSYTNNANGTITDNVTQLMWQQGDGGEMTIENAILYAQNLVLGGFSDWRLPIPIEGFSILNHQNNNPAMNTTFFTSSAAGYWWTSSFQAGDASKVWCTNAGGGIGNHPKSETISAGGTKKFHARCVRDISPPTTFTNHFTDNGNGTITDNLTQLIWQKAPNTAAQTWEAALGYAENLNLANIFDWRLPNIKELQSLNDESLTNPSANTTYFATIGVKNYWSATSLPNQVLKAWYWNTQFGITTYDTKTNSNYVICVSGNPTVLGLKTINNSAEIKVFPNPFSTTIAIENVGQDQDFELYNAFGQSLFYGKNIQKQDFSGLPKGVYFLIIINNETNLSVKLVKQ